MDHANNQPTTSSQGLQKLTIHHTNYKLAPTGKACEKSRLGTMVNDQGGATTATSWRRGGVDLVRAAGSADFVADDIALVAWRALGSRDGGEIAGEAY
jgi:hypothetical protein